MSYDQVAGAFGGDDASSGGASQGGKGIHNEQIGLRNE